MYKNTNLLLELLLYLLKIQGKERDSCDNFTTTIHLLL